MALENDDNLIDFNTLHILKKPPGDDFDYCFKQFREVVPRSCKFDPVTKLALVFDDSEYSYAVTLRQSNKVDFYFNLQFVSSFDGKNISD